LLAVIHNQRIDSLIRERRVRHGNSDIVIMSVNGASTIFGLLSKLIVSQCVHRDL
jgi:hypothetical protein